MIETIIHYFENAAQLDYIGEPISQLEHALQAAHFAKQAKYSEAVVIACLLHDIGHFDSTIEESMNGFGVHNHQWIGAKLALQWGFSEKIATLIGYHVDAKRYLVSCKKDYLSNLSQASKETLLFQGGPMSLAEQADFKSHPLFKEILQVRVCDEKAKEPNLQVPTLDHYSELLATQLNKKC